MESIWRKQTGKIDPQLDVTSPFSKDIHKDVIVVGAGMAGLLTAYMLKEQGKDVLVLEADEIASGQTERTTAKITSQHGLKYHKMIKSVGLEKTRIYARANEAAIKEYERLISENHIECQFEKVPAYLYATQNEKILEEEAQAASFLGIDACFTKETRLPFAVKGAVCFQNQAQFSPLAFLRHISDRLEILEHTPVRDIHKNMVITKDIILTADKIVVATHYPVFNVPGFYFMRQHQERSYVLALSGCDRIDGMYYCAERNGLSFRQAGEYLLLGGGAHRTGENKSGGAYATLLQAAKTYYPECREEARWSAQDCMPHDGIPFIGNYSVFTPDLYVATGFQKWGMTSSMVAAMILRDKLCGIENPYEKVFSPQRVNLRAAAAPFFIDAGLSTKGLVGGLFHRPKCAHMGCRLVWNPDERSWDCPCHGSRFDAEGKLLDNPARDCISNHRVVK